MQLETALAFSLFEHFFRMLPECRRRLKFRCLRHERRQNRTSTANRLHDPTRGDVRIAHRVGRKKANPWGLFDMHGNAAEWTGDKYDAAYYAISPKTNPFDDPGAALYPHAVRGGSWDDDAPRLRSAARRTSMEAWSRRDPQNPKSLWWHTDATFVGFRVVAEMDNPPR